MVEVSTGLKGDRGVSITDFTLDEGGNAVTTFDNGKTKTSKLTSIASASASAKKAATSESNAKDYADKALASETNAKTSETNTATYADNAKKSEEAAKTSEANAKASERSAKSSEEISSTKAEEASASAASASNSATKASGSELNAAKSAESAENSYNKTVSIQSNFQAVLDTAKASEIAAKASETNAKTSETSSADSANKAHTSEINTKVSETNAAASASTATAQASNAGKSATAAKASETNAKSSETASATSEANAKASASNAAMSASNSASSASASEVSNQYSKKWAESTGSPDGLADTDSTTGKTQSSRSWALYSKAKAQESASSATSASASASSAASSAASARDSKDKASEYKTSASGSATAAASSASSASAAATNARAAMNTANTAASSASTSAINASTSASNASKSEVAAKSAQAEAERARDEANSALAKISGALKYMGQVDNYNDLPSTGNSKGDTWNVVNADPSHHIKAGDNVAWNGTEWDDLSGVVDLSAYAEKADYQKAITSATANGATITFNHKDGTTSTATVNNVASSTSATNDAKGQKIDTTYEKIADASNVHTSLQNSINTKQDKLTFDTTPTANSSNPVTSSGIKTALDTKLDKTGTAVSATKLQTARTLSLTGDASGSVTFNGTSNVSINTAVNESKHAADVTDATVSPEESNHGGVTVPASGVIENLNTVTGSNDLTSTNKLRSYIGSINNGDWYNVISIRHRNGTTDGTNYGLLMYSKLTDKNDTIHYKKQTTDWTEERTLLDSSNYNNYAPTKTGGGASGTWGINISGTATKAKQDASGNIIEDTYLKLDSFKSSLIASLPACYERSTMWSAAKNIITVPDYITVNIGNNGYVKTGASTIDINTASNWDNSTYTTSANRAGKDFYIYACQDGGTVPKFVLSANSTVPSGYTATNSRKIGGFHCECADVGTIDGHPLSGYIAGDILPRSIWDLKHRPVSSPEGMVWCDGVWVDIYLAGWDGSKLVSQYKAVIQDGDSTKKWHGELFNEEFHKIKKRLLWRDEFAAYAKGSNEKTNISGSTDPNTTGGHKDTANRRMISNYGLEDCCGVLWQWTNDISMRGIVTNGTDSDYASSGNYWLDGYGWDSSNRIGNSDIDGDKTKYGNEYGLLVRLFAGGYWVDGSNCGSRSVSGSDLSALRYGHHAGRGASEPWVG